MNVPENLPPTDSNRGDVVPEKITARITDIVFLLLEKVSNVPSFIALLSVHVGMSGDEIYVSRAKVQYIVHQLLLNHDRVGILNPENPEALMDSELSTEDLMELIGTYSREAGLSDFQNPDMKKTDILIDDRSREIITQAFLLFRKGELGKHSS